MQPSLVVLKFGSSALRTADDLPRAVDEIYRHVREGRRVVAVVSAFAGETDRLLSQVARFGSRCDPRAIASLLALGEESSAAQLNLALDQSGIPSCVLHPRDIGLLAAGEPLDSVPVDVERARLTAQFERCPVIVIPGFIAVGREGHTVLLGRGGSDLSALFIAQRLQAQCILIKDVDGLYVSDPALPGPPPRRYCTVGWEEALRVGGELVQGKALEWCKAHRWPFDISGFGLPHGTHVTNGASLTAPNTHKAPVRVTLLGLGVVGRGVYERLRAYPDRFQIERILVRHPEKHIATGVPAELLTTDPGEIARAETDIVVEALCGGEPALALTFAALAVGRKVVTANKANIAAEWLRLRQYMRGDDSALRFAAAVGGAVPALEVVEQLRSNTRVVRVRAVLNGTCNFILERMHEGATYGDALEEARAEGFAEADPYLDVSGLDAESKLVLISLKAFGEVPTTIERHGIDRLSPTAVEATRPSTSALKLVATASLQKGVVQGRIAPELLNGSDYLAGARFEHNRFEITLENGETIQLSGRGAGRWPTATAVMGDVWSIARERWSGVHAERKSL